MATNQGVVGSNPAGRATISKTYGDSIHRFVFQRRKIVTTTIGKVQAGSPFYPMSQVFRRQMGLPLSQFSSRTRAQFLKHMKWCTVLHLPTCRCMTQIVPTKSNANLRTNNCFTPRPRCNLCDGFISIGKYPHVMFSTLVVQDLHSSYR